MAEVGERQRHAQRHQNGADGFVDRALMIDHPRAQRLPRKEQRHQAKPEKVGERHEQAVAKLRRQRRRRLHHLGVGADDEHGGFRIQRVGQESIAEHAEGGDGAFLVQVDRQLRFVRERLPTDDDQIQRAGDFDGGKERGGMGDDQRDAEHRVEHVDLYAEGDAQRGQQAGVAAVQIAIPRHHGEVRAGADGGEYGDQGDGDKFSHVFLLSESGVPRGTMPRDTRSNYFLRNVTTSTSRLPGWSTSSWTIGVTPCST